MEFEYGTVVSLLRKVCQENATNLALVGTRDVSLSYAQMGERIWALSRHLVKIIGVRPGQAVGLCMDRSFDHIVAVCAVLKAGGIYVPMDPELPQKRLAYMMKDAQLAVILTQRRYILDLENILSQHQEIISSQLVLVDGLVDKLLSSLRIQVQSDLEMLPEPHVEDPAYMIYTSGSTGEPKGVMVPHRGLLALSMAAAETWELRKAESRMLQFSSHCFDASICEIFPALCSGAVLVLGSRNELLPGHQLAEFIRNQRVTVTLLPPSVMATLNDFSSSLPLLRTIIAGGEACSLALAHKWSTTERKFINAYGPTECTVITTMHVFDPTSDDLKTVPLGEPLPGWQVHLLNDHLQPVQDGEVGEIYISGVGLSLGYHNKPRETAKYFISHPKVGIALYRSGDLGVRRRASKGLLEFAGRVDNQIKINGFRVELGAVEQALCEHPVVEYAAVKAVEANGDGSNHMLVAYVVLKVQEDAESQITSEFLNYFLLDRLPKYMVPVIYVTMDALPLTANRGKVDRKALPHHSTLPYLHRSSQTNSAKGPDVELEANSELQLMTAKCCALFEKVLNLSPGIVKRDSSFFHLGGSSLWVAKLVHEVQDTFDVELLSWQIYKHPTPEQLTCCIIQTQKSKAGSKSSNREQEVDAEELLREGLSLDKSLRPIEGLKTSSSVALMTGVTGFLGAFLLENLLLENSFQVIYCLVRGTSPAHAWDRLLATRKKYGLQTKTPVSNIELVMLAGDVQQSKLGLSDEVYSQLSDHVDLIYHVAADTNYIRPYGEMRQPNVEGTRNILHFAATGPSLKTLHYVSTIGLFGSLSGFTCSTLDENFNIQECLPFFSQGETGYTKSKWVAEVMVLDFMSRGFPVSIYRPGFIEAHSVTGVANIDDMMCRYIKGCIQMGSYPNLPRKYWEPIPVNFAADAITYISLREAPGQIYNLVPNREREMGNQAIFQCLTKDGRCKVQELSIQHWLDALAKIPPSNALYPLIAYLSERIHENHYTPLEMPVAKFGFENTRRALQSSDIEIPGFDENLLRRYVQFLDT
ncbi:hypothetical protein R1flu_013429 [Riccia fluitans]|uniref:Carrier domain-containing protein n=1 Tax=Riccia fluitans TaxID=41844 RepID=A0ABD1YDA6_9MARC